MNVLFSISTIYILYRFLKKHTALSTARFAAAMMAVSYYSIRFSDYATSDTYFLWKKYPDKEIDYPFILAYLNSKIVRFLFNAKNITIKRSKTKLEQGLPIPHISNFIDEQKKAIIELIKLLSSYLIWINTNNDNYENPISVENIQATKYFSYYKNIKLEQKLLRSLENYDLETINTVLDQLFFKLFNLDGNLINKLLNQYYGL